MPKQTHSHWWENATIYQIYPRSFMDSDANGIGDLAGVLLRLDYLKTLGVDAIWFSPIHPSPMKDFGYDVADYTAIHPDFGTLSDFDKLLKAAQDQGIRIILDLVPNHTSDQHAWFIESRSSLTNPKRDWYIWKDPNPQGEPPNNWQSFFGGSAWEWDSTTQQYYLHNFLKEQPDLNWRNPEVKQAMFDGIRFWLDRGVAGFRIDVIDVMLKDVLFRDEPPNPDYNPATDTDRMKNRIVYSAYQEEVHALIQEMRTVFDEYEDRVMIGEVDYTLGLAKLASYYGEGNELHLPFNFRPLMMTRDQTPTATELMAYITEYDRTLGENNTPNWVFGNHDTARLASRVQQAVRAYAMLMLTLRGAAFIYYGEELGMVDVEIAHADMQDPFGINFPSQGRDRCRTPMQWDSSPNGGFSSAEAKTWLPLAPNHQSVNVFVQQRDPHSILSLYRKLLLLRRTLPPLSHGSYIPFENPPQDVVAYWRKTEREEVLLIVLNLSPVERDIDLKRTDSASILLSTELDRQEEVTLGCIPLRPYEGVILRIFANLGI
ncbi:MAG: alpha-amylase family glycosyl hydrolase [Phototrophicaceae bacterium]